MQFTTMSILLFLGLAALTAAVLAALQAVLGADDPEAAAIMSLMLKLGEETGVTATTLERRHASRHDLWRRSTALRATPMSHRPATHTGHRSHHPSRCTTSRAAPHRPGWHAWARARTRAHGSW